MTSRDAPQELLELFASMSSPVPKIYANAVTVLLSNGDVAILLKQNSEVVGVLNLSYTVSKTLANTLNGAIAELETTTDQHIMTSDEIGQKMQSQGEK